MAESVLSDIAVGLISKLGSSVLEEIGLWWGVTDELDKLKRTVSTVEAVLLHAEEQSLENPQVKTWLEMLSEAMYDADDLLDEFSTEALRQQVVGAPKMVEKARLFFSSSNQVAFGLKMGHKVKALRERLDEIAANRRFHLEERSHVRRGSGAIGRDQTHSSPPQVVIGREDEKEAILELLLSSDYEENVSVVPIVGIGGLGKTTLAQLVYNDGRVKNHFELKMWVCVSDDFDVQLLVKKVLESATGLPPQNTQMDQLKNLLHEKINGRRYLLVLDDVWNEDVNKWSLFQDLLTVGDRGSKIVITTRLRKAAETSRPIFIHNIRGLSESEAWLLFKQVAFKRGQEPSPSHEAIGREIVGKCCGVPLAIKAIAGMLYFKDLESEWLLFRDEELSKIDVYKNDILPILKLSYNHLPSHYKHCFACCSLYPKDFKIPVEELIYLWKAQGYLKSTYSNECLQEVGFRYFMDFFRLSFFQEDGKDDFGNIIFCKMHDLIHDMAILVAGVNFCGSLSRMTSIEEKTRHMSFPVEQNSMSRDFSSLLKAKKIRTVLALVEEPYPFVKDRIRLKRKELDNLFCNLRCLRVLNLSYLESGRLPSSIYKLRHLRYLDLSAIENIKKLPDSITNLLNLLVLKLSWCENLLQLPNNIKKLVNLTDLDIYGCYGLTHMPQGIGKLTRLETLSLFVVAKDNFISRFMHESAGLDELHALNNLRGELHITNLDCVKNVEYEFKAADLSAKKLLQNLTLSWSNSGDGNDRCIANDEMGLEALRPHQNLKDLSVWDYRGVRPPSWLPSITNLMFILFQDCRSINWFPPFDQLPYLERLWLESLSNLERIDVGNGGFSPFFPSLKNLILKDCPKLTGFVRCKTEVGMSPSSLSTEELPCFPCLSQLSIEGCHNLTDLPHFPKLKKLLLTNDGIISLMKVMKMRTTSTSQSSSSSSSTLPELEHLLMWQMEDSPEDDELLQYLPSLQHLEFWNCSFKNLVSDDMDDSMQWQSLKVLRSVEFGDMLNLVSLPKRLQHCTTLQRLVIKRCPSLACIPEWMDNLVALQHLDIDDSPQLSERCKNDTAEDWPKISHIPNISIDNVPIQRNGCYLL